MRKLIVFNMITADGYFEGNDNDISWHQVDEEVNDAMVEQLKTGDTLVFGRKTFEVMETYWPEKKAFEENPSITKMMNNYPKVVFSTTRDSSPWQNTKWHGARVVEEINALKDQPGKNIFVFGSADLCKTLIKNDLVDEYRLMINPVALGKGKPLFKEKLDLQLVRTKVFGNGNILVCYRPV